MRGESASSNTHSKTSESSGNIRKRYVDHLRDRSRHTSLIHGPDNSLDECNVLGEFGSNYSNIRPTKDHGHDTATRKKMNRQKEKNSIVNHAVKGILLQETNKISAEAEAHTNIQPEIDENDLYQI